jgi:hypothetical protein
MAHPFKKVADDILEALLESGPRAGRALRDRSDKQAKKIRDDIERISSKDRELGRKVRPRETDVDAPDKPRASPDAPGLEVKPVEPLDVDTYAELRRRALTGDALEHDHIPSAAALIRAQERRLRRELRPEEIRELYNDAASIELPASVHRATRTYGGRNTKGQIADDARDLAAAANLDYSDRIALLLEDGVPLDEIERAIAELIRMNRERGIG